jgi:hypothetical protein
MAEQNFYFWRCPDCIHVRDLDMEKMTNRCRLIDQGASPVDGTLWENQDHDLCPVFEPKANQRVPILIAEGRTTQSL